MDIYLKKKSFLELVFFTGLWNNITTLEDEEALFWCNVLLLVCQRSAEYIGQLTQIHRWHIVIWVAPIESLNVAIPLFPKSEWKKRKRSLKNLKSSLHKVNFISKYTLVKYMSGTEQLIQNFLITYSVLVTCSFKFASWKQAWMYYKQAQVRPDLKEEVCTGLEWTQIEEKNVKI